MTTDNRTQLLTTGQKDEYLQAVSRGASPSQACNMLGVTMEALEATEEADADFAEGTERAGVLLSQNAAAKLYREGQDGNIPALTFLLKNNPPPEWTRKDPLSMTDDDLDNLSDEELEAMLEKTERLVAGLRGS